MATVSEGKGTWSLGIVNRQGRLVKREIGRPKPGPNDVHIDIAMVGMCHSDVHAACGDWGFQGEYMAPGHEIVGHVRTVGDNVKDIKVGQRVGVGCMVESCRECEECKDGLEQHCRRGMVQTYSSPFPKGKGHDECEGVTTNGGYSTDIVVNEHFVFALPDSLPTEVVGPLLCAGITTYSPLARHVKGKKNASVGVLGLGGLGHMVVKIAAAMGAEVVVYSRSTKKEEAAKKMGATALCVTSDEEAVKANGRRHDVIIDTVSASHDVMALLPTLKVGGAIVLVGGVTEPAKVAAFPLLMGRYKIEGSLIGGVPETAEMLAFCAEHKIFPEVEVIPCSKAADAFETLKSGNAPPGRSVIDMSTIGDL